MCAADTGARARFYGSAAVADDIDAVRATLGVDKLDLWGDSYGTYLMPVYAARHPQHVRSIVLDGAFPIAFDPWGRDVLRGTRAGHRARLRRTRRCSGPRVLAQLERLARRLRRHPVHLHRASPIGRVPLTLGEHELANVIFGGGHPEVYGVAARRRRRRARPRLRAAAAHGGGRPDRPGRQSSVDPSLFSFAAGTATTCHDYPRPFSLAATPAERRVAYDRALAALEPAQFAPFSRTRG